MSVYFDNEIFNLQKFGGISRYFVELLKHLNEEDLCHARVIAPFYDNYYLKELLQQHPDYNKHLPFFKLFNSDFLKRPDFYRRNFTKLFFNVNKKNILHETYYYKRIEVKSKIVITIHDMIFERYNNGSQFHKETIHCKKEAINRADAIICVSNNTLKDLLEYYPSVASKSFVVHHGISKISYANNVPLVTSKPYILYVGHRDWYKNFKSLLSVYTQNKMINNDVDLICFGGDEFNEEEIKYLKNNHLLNKVFYVSGNDELLNLYYSKATVFAYLSEYEGFGMPLLEAMSNHCPILCSNTSSLPEVAGSAAKMVNPLDLNEIEYGLTSIIFNTSYRNSLVIEGNLQLQKFSWKKCAQETNLIYKTLLP